MKKSKNYLKKRLNNNLDLVIYFIYKHIAGDRCQVTFEAEIDVEIKEDYFKDRVLNNLDFKSVKSLLGEKTSYNYRKTKNFISLDEKDKVFDDLKQQFLDSDLGYISSQSFPVKLIIRNYILAQRDETNRSNKEAYFKDIKRRSEYG